MRFGVDIRSLLEGRPSGVSLYTYELVKKLIQLNRSDQYILFWYSKNLRHNQDIFREFKANNYRLEHRHWPSRFINMLHYLSVGPALDRTVSPVDLFFMPNLNFYSLSKNCPLVLTVHDLSFRLPGFYFFKNKIWHRAIQPRKNILRANKIIAVSESTKRDLIEQYRVPEEKVSVIYHGVSDRYFNKENQAAKSIVLKKYHLPEKYILFLGNLEIRKNVSGLIAAWQALKTEHKQSFPLVLCGSLQKGYLPGLPEGIIHIGYCDEEDKPALYQLASFMVYPSFYEGFGLPVLEAMASGCPVICSYATSIPEVTRGAALLVNPYRIAELTAAMEALANDQQYLSNLSSAGQVVARQFTWEKAARSTLELFHSIT